MQFAHRVQLQFDFYVNFALIKRLIAQIYFKILFKRNNYQTTNFQQLLLILLILLKIYH